MADQAIIIAHETTAHDPRVRRLHPAERGGHVLVVGAPTKAKQALMLNMMAQDIAAGAGVCVIDVTGQFARRLLDSIPSHRSNHTLYFELGNAERVVGFNPFNGVPPLERSRAAQHLMALFVAIWGLRDDTHPLMLRLLRASAQALLDSQEGTLLGMYALLTNADYRRRIVAQCHDPMARRFWTDFEGWSHEDKRDKPQPVLTRLEAFLSDPYLRSVLGQVKSTLDVERVVRERQILLVDLPQHVLGAETARLFACLLAVRLQTLLEARRGGWPYFVYLPEAQHIHVALTARALTGRYRNAGMVAGIDQLMGYAPPERNALMSAGRIITFRLGVDDARAVVGRFPLAQAEAALTTLADSRLALSGHKYELEAYAVDPMLYKSREHILRRSRDILGVPRAPVEGMIERFLDGLSDAA